MPGGLFKKKPTSHIQRRDERYQTEGLRCPAGKVVDLSSSGMRIRAEGKPRLRRGDVQSFALATTTRRLTVQGAVAWVRRRSMLGREYDIGVRFVNLSPSMRTVLKNLAQYGFLGRLGHDGASSSGAAAGADAASRSTAGSADARTAGGGGGGGGGGVVAEIELDDCYGILGVPPTATAEQIRAAYRRLATQHHPDAGGNAETFVQINRAWSTLKDASSRARYDQLLRHASGARKSA